MRKRIVTAIAESAPEQKEWLPVEDIAQVEITSEDPNHPIEAALLPGQGAGWRAADPGVQSLRLLFDTPQQLRRIRLCFVEMETERTQEFVVRYSNDNGQSFRDIVRQQWVFSLWGATREVEEYQVELQDVTALELTIIPNISNANAHASLAELRLA